MPNKKTSRLLLILAFAAVYFVWGSTYMANLFALESMKPFVLSCLRYLVAGGLLVAWSLYRKLSWPDLKMIKILAISGIIMLVGGSGLVAYAEQYISSGYAAVIIATEPFLFVMLDKKRWSLYFSSFKVIAGLVLGFAGIALFMQFAPEIHQSAGTDTYKLTGTIIVLVSAIFWVLGTLYANRNLKPGSSNIVNSAVQLLAAGLFAGVVALFHGEWKTFNPAEFTFNAWCGLLFLIVMGSLVAYLAFTWLVTVQPPAVVSTHTYVNPVVAILIGCLVAGEQIVWKQVMALALVLAGVLFTQLGKQRNVEEPSGVLYSGKKINPPGKVPEKKFK